MTLRWTSLLVRGLIGIAFGVVAMVWPDETVVVLVVLWGCWALLDGLMTVGFGLFVPGAGAKVFVILVGLVSLLVAFFALVRPGMAAATLTWFLGVWLVVRGVFELVGAFSAPSSSARWALVLSGVLDGAIGLLFMFNPGTASLAIAFLIGLLAFLWGAAFVGLALIARHAAQVETPGAPGAPSAALG